MDWTGPVNRALIGSSGTKTSFQTNPRVVSQLQSLSEAVLSAACCYAGVLQRGAVWWPVRRTMGAAILDGGNVATHEVPVPFNKSFFYTPFLF